MAVRPRNGKLLRGQARGLRRLSEHVLRGSATPGQIASALEQVAVELDRMAGPPQEKD